MIAQGHGLVGARSGRKSRNVLTDVVLTDEHRALIEANTGLAGLAAKQATEWWGVDNDDAYASALFGLCKAAVGFDEANGAKFSTYAVNACVKTIWRDLVFRPTAMRDTTRRNGKARPASRVVSMDDEIGAGDGKRRRRGSLIPDHRERTPPEQLEHDENMREARRWIDEITAESPRMHTVIRIRAQGGTLQEAGEALGVTRERARQLEDQHVGCSFGYGDRVRRTGAIAS